MKTTALIIKILIAIMIFISLYSTVVELDIAKRAITIDDYELLDGHKFYDKKSKQEVLELMQNGEVYVHGVFKIKLIWDIIIAFFLLTLLFIGIRMKKNLK